MFNSNWENEISKQLESIDNKLDNLIYSINQMESNIVNSLSDLSYLTQDSFEILTQSVSHHLGEMKSSVNINNLLTGIQAFQLYKINKNS